MTNETQHSSILSDYSRRKLAKESAMYREQLRHERNSNICMFVMMIAVAAVACSPWIAIAIR